MSFFRTALKSVPWLQRAVQSVRWLGRLLRVWWSRNRQFLVYPPGHYYSPLPDYAGLDRAIANPESELPGIDLNSAGQADLLRSLAAFVPDQPFPEQPTPGVRYYFENAFFTYPDALVLYAMLRHMQPRRVVEVGSGFSSAVMLDTRDRFLDPDIPFTFIDPEPGRLGSLLRPADRERCTILSSRVQDVGLEPFQTLEANDILFVDSSHVTKVGSDVNHIVFKVLPALRPGVLIHIHDIFWPFEYPAKWFNEGRAWNEAYLVRAFLQHSSAFEVVLFVSYLEQHHSTLLAALMPLARKRAITNPAVGGSSLWLRKR
jgi:predicted O-methyltransferase YrrM